MADPREFRTSRGVVFTSTLTDLEATQVCEQYPAGHSDRSFARSLTSQARQRGLSPRQLPYLHQLAMALLDESADVRHWLDRQRNPQPVQQAPRRTAPREQSTSTTVREQSTSATITVPHLTVQPQPETVRDHVAGMKLCMLQYDIPNTGANRTPVFENPSYLLRQYAIRTTLSVWVIPEDRIPYGLLNEMTDAGCTWHVVRFDMGDVAKLVEMVGTALAKETAEAMDRLHSSLDRAGELHATEVKQDKHIDKAVERCQTLLGDLESAAAVFGLTMDKLPIRQALGSIRLLQSDAYAKARAYGKAVETARTASVDSAGIARAIDQGENIHPGVLADVLTDAGEYERASELETTFQF